MPKRERIRLDVLLANRGLAQSRSLARSLIMAGRVRVGGRVMDKAGTQVSPDSEVEIEAAPRFVSRAGEKLAWALEALSVDVAEVRALDVGASTGGFTDCLLQHGAREVIALDVGYGQLDERLRNDSRVHVMERTNARYLAAEDLPFRPDFITADVSFISLQKILPPVFAAAAPAFRALLLVKPQFEAGPAKVGRGGIVRDPAVRRDVLLQTVEHVLEQPGLGVLGVTDSGLPGTGDNLEYFIYAARPGVGGLSLATLEDEIDRITTGGEPQVHGSGANPSP